MMAFVVISDDGARVFKRLDHATRTLVSLGQRGVGATLMESRFNPHHPAGGVIAQTLAERGIETEEDSGLWLGDLPTWAQEDAITLRGV